MAKRVVYHHIIRIERDNYDYLLPRNFFSILVCQFFPTISLIYLISIVGISLATDNPLHYMFFENMAYLRGIVIVAWCAPPAIIWILLSAHPLVSHVANLWYKILAGLLVLTIALSYVLFPEMQIYGMRAYLILSFPAFFFMYYLFVVDPLPLEIVYPLNALGACALIWGLYVGSVF